MFDRILELVGLGRLSAYADFMESAYQAGQISGEVRGYNQGYLEGNNAGYDSGHKAGRSRAYQVAFDDGYGLGLKVGKIIAERAAALEKIKEQERLAEANAALAEAAEAGAADFAVEFDARGQALGFPARPSFFLKKGPNDA